MEFWTSEQIYGTLRREAAKNGSGVVLSLMELADECDRVALAVRGVALEFDKHQRGKKSVLVRQDTPPKAAKRRRAR